MPDVHVSCKGRRMQVSWACNNINMDIRQADVV